MRTPEKKRAARHERAALATFSLEPSAQANDHGTAWIVLRERRVVELEVGTLFRIGQVDHVNRELRNPGVPEPLAEVEAGREVVLGIVLAEQFSGGNAVLTARAGQLRATR